MSLLMVIPLAAAIAAIGLQIATLMGFLLAGFTTVVASLAAVIGLVLLL